MKLNLSLDDVPLGTMRMARAGDKRVCVIHTSDGIHALDNACPHEGYGLATGSLDGDLVTCAWHNWKFRVSDGTCVLGEENVVSHRVKVLANGELDIELAAANPAQQRSELLTSLRRGIERDYVGQVSRDVIRLLRADMNPGELMWEAVAYGAPRAEYGWGHSIASLTDCLAIAESRSGDARVLPIVQGIAGVAEMERGRPTNLLPDPATRLPSNPRAEFRSMVNAENLEGAQALLRAAIHSGKQADVIRPWFTDIVSDHLLSYGHGAIYTHKAFQLLDRLGWDRADTVLPHLLPTIVYATRENKLPYAKPFTSALQRIDLDHLADRSATVESGWDGHDELVKVLLGPDRAQPADATADALAAGAGLEGILDAVTVAVSERMLRYDATGERDFHDDFGWLDITHGLTYANAARWLIRNSTGPTPDLVRLVMWTVFLANWTGRHEWHTQVGPRQPVPPPLVGRGADPGEPTSPQTYGELLQQEALSDGTTAFIVHAHAVKMSVAATEEALRLESAVPSAAFLPLDATARFLREPRLERFVAATVTRSIDFLSGRTSRND